MVQSGLETPVRELQEVGDGVWAYLQGRGGWGWSNAGLVTGGESALLVDTLFDLRLTREMLEEMRRATPAAGRIGTVVNTHANGDHCYGNAVLAGAEFVASRACAAEIDELPPSLLASYLEAAPELGELGEFVQRIFGSFDVAGIDLVRPTRTFDEHLELRVGDRPVHLIEVGPAHTRGDVVVHLPDDGVVFSGDIVFHGAHPVVWAGPVANWIRACDRILALDGIATVVPGHGPLAALQAVADTKAYFEHLVDQASPRYQAGMTPLEAARDVDLAAFGHWGERERLVVNLTAIYQDLGADVPTDVVTLYSLMAELAGSDR